MHQSRLNTIKTHLSAMPKAQKENSLEEYRNRGSKIDKELLRSKYYALGFEYYQDFFEKFAKAPSFEHFSTVDATTDQKREHYVKNLTHLLDFFDFDRHSHETNPLRGFVFGRVYMNYDLGSCVKLGVNGSLYLDSLLALGTEKHKELVEKAYNLVDIGCFALTELGHGSNAAKIETRADYHKETQEFVINTPNDLATKWWIGGAAKTSNKCVVLAQLYIDNESKGVHVFVVDLRDFETHQVKEGVVIGDCGPKAELDGVDNGFIIFRNYRVPYDALLDRYAQITSEGYQSIIEKREKRFGAMLAGLIRGRTGVLSSSEGNLKNGLTIAIRFAAARRQFGNPNSPEKPILDYSLTRVRLMPWLANVIATGLCCDTIFSLYPQVKDKIKANPECHEALELHAILSVLKCLATDWARDGLTECRQVCGGLGYSGYSRLGQLLMGHHINLTWEGDNHVLVQQTSAFIMKNMRSLIEGKSIQAESLKFIDANSDNLNYKSKLNQELKPEDLLEALKFRTNYLMHKSFLRLQENVGNSESMFEAWNKSQPLFLQELAKSFGVYLLAQKYLDWVGSFKEHIETANIAMALFKLFVLDKVNTDSGIFLESGFLSVDQVQLVRNKFLEHCEVIGENSLNIIDSIANPNNFLGSVLGHSDGNIYGRMIDAVESNPNCYGPPPFIKSLRELRRKAESRLNFK